MTGSAPAAGISLIISFNKTGEKKIPKQNVVFTPLTSQLILSIRQCLWVAFPMAFLHEVWSGSQPGPGSRVPTVTSRAAAAGERDG